MHVQAEIVLPEFNGFAPQGGNFYGSEKTLIIANGRLSIERRALKRSFDIVSSAAVLILASPMLLIVAIAIKIDSPGPVLFRQPRIGRQNRLFSILKFRTMTAASCDPTGICSTARDDPRITRTGRFLRRTSIDELPQLLNVLRGEMSIVGPRPHAINSTVEDRLFWDADRKYWMRHACKPGLTGLAQIRGLRGATDCMKDLTDRVEADLSYLQSFSFWNDLVIIARTLRVLIGKKAY
jgi:lipopolysaccharide/colanic/teichoic acid biosynthesis glycosyltransferase